jgi:hypothetical protein
MQNYIDSNPIPLRPSFGDIRTKKARQKFPSAFTDDAELIKTMKAVKHKHSGVLTTGLWPLDTVSCFGWRDTTRNPKAAFTEHISMAKIEMSIVSSYRAKLLKNCPEAAFIRTNIATALSDACKFRSCMTINPRTKKPEAHQARKFTYADKVHFAPALASTPPVDVHLLKSRRQASARSSALTTEAVSMLKRLESLKAAAAVPDSKKVDPQIYEAVTNLQTVCFQYHTLYLISSCFPQLLSQNIARLVKMQAAKEHDEEADMNPLLPKYQPEEKDIPSLHFNRQAPFEADPVLNCSAHESPDAKTEEEVDNESGQESGNTSGEESGDTSGEKTGDIYGKETDDEAGETSGEEVVDGQLEGNSAENLAEHCDDMEEVQRPATPVMHPHSTSESMDVSPPPQLGDLLADVVIDDLRRPTHGEYHCLVFPNSGLNIFCNLKKDALKRCLSNGHAPQQWDHLVWIHYLFISDGICAHS